LGFGTLLLPYSVNLFGHALAAVFGFGAWILLRDRSTDMPVLVGAGALAGAAVAAEYQAAIIALVLFAYAVVTARARAAWYLVGTLPAGIVLAAYQWRAFGLPWRTPFAYYAGEIAGTTEGGYSIPRIAQVLDVITGERGLLLLSPLVVIGVAAAVVVTRSAGQFRRDGAVAVAIAFGYLLLVAGWSGTETLETPGPRYLVPMVPFLAAPVAALWGRLRVACIAAAAWGAALQVTATTTSLLIGQSEPAVRAYLDRLREGRFAPTIWSLTLGRAGVVVYLGLAALSVAWLVNSVRADRVEDVRAAVCPDGRIA
jgi:hypothetical protein